MLIADFVINSNGNYYSHEMKYSCDVYFVNQLGYLNVTLSCKIQIFEELNGILVKIVTSEDVNVFDCF